MDIEAPAPTADPGEVDQPDGPAASGCPFAPGPAGKPVIGNMAEYRADPVGLSVRTARDHGPVARLKIGPYAVTQVTDPDAIERVLQSHARRYNRGKFYQAFGLFMGRGLLTLDDEDWRRHRKVVRPAFQPRVVQAHSEQMAVEVDRLLDRWQQFADSGEPVDLVPEVMRLTLSALSASLLGRDLGDRIEEVSSAVKFALAAIIEQISSVHRFVPGWVPTRHNRKLRHALAVLDGTVADVVAERRRTGPTGRDGDLVDLLLASDLDDVAIRDEIVTILLAGHETTGVAAAWTLYAVAQHPDVRERLESEVDGVLPGGRAPLGDQLDALPYTRAVVAESLRLYPPIWQYPRDAAEDDVLAGYRVEKGSSVFLSVLATHHDPGLWPDPEVFDPTRFLTEEDRHRFAYLPFGGGRRVCIGQRFALLLLWTLMAGAARRYHLSVVPGQHIRSGALLSLHPTDGIVVTLRERAR